MLYVLFDVSLISCIVCEGIRPRPEVEKTVSPTAGVSRERGKHVTCLHLYELFIEIQLKHSAQ